MHKKNKINKKIVIIILFLSTFMIALILNFFQPIINKEVNDTYIYWPIIDESKFDATINDYSGHFDHLEFQNIFEDILIDSIGNNINFDYIYNEKIIASVEYNGNKNIENPEHKYIFHIIENYDYV